MKKVEQYKSDAGAVFDNACDALKDDVRHWLISAAGNDPIAKQVATRISEDIGTFAPMIAALAECCGSQGMIETSDGPPQPVAPERAWFDDGKCVHDIDRKFECNYCREAARLMMPARD